MDPISLSEEAALKRVHDLSNALRTLRLVCEELEAGYRFDDSDAEENIRALRRAAACLDEAFKSEGFTGRVGKA